MWQKIVNFFKSIFASIGNSTAPIIKLDYSKMPKLAEGSTGEAVKILQARLKSLGFFTGEVRGNFYEITANAVAGFQRSRGLTPDEVVGPVTWKELEKDNAGESVPAKEKAPSALGDFFGAIWISFAIPLLGMNEASVELQKILVPWWKRVGLPGWSSLVGAANAWCALFVDWLLNKAGLKGPGSAMAKDTAKFGVPAGGYWFGAPFSMRHPSGGYHTGFYLYWIDKSKGIAAVLSGNSGNIVCVRAYNLSGNKAGHDEIVGGLRWGKEWAPGKEVSMQEVLSKYPKLAYIGMSSQTR